MTLEIWPVVFVIPERYWWRCFSVRSSRRRCSIKKVFLKISQYSQENTCVWVSFLIKLQDSASNFIKKVTLTHEYSCEFCEIFKNICFEVASDDYFSSAFLPPIKSHFLLRFLSVHNFRTILCEFRYLRRGNACSGQYHCYHST